MSEADATTAGDVAIEFDASGLVPVVAQQADSGEVLMLAYANADAIARTAETGLAHYYSRSRGERWQKGATSGNVQRVESVRVDCDGDALLYQVSQEGGACHTGHGTCFYRSVEGISGEDHGAASEDDNGNRKAKAKDGADEPSETLTVETAVVGDRVFDPETVYE